MDETAAEGEDEFDWNTEDELEIENYSLSTSSCLTSGGEVLSGSGSGTGSGTGSGEASPTGSSDSRLFDHFVGMGFPENMVVKALMENCGENDDVILEYLLASMAPQEQQSDDSDQMSSYFEGSLCEGSSDFDSSESETDEPSDYEVGDRMRVGCTSFNNKGAPLCLC